MPKKEPSFVEYCIQVYESLGSSVANFNFDRNLIYESFLSSALSNEKISTLNSLYRKFISETIEQHIQHFRDDLDFINKLKDIQYFENTISIYVSFIIFWIVERKIELSNDDVKKISSAILIETLGYRLLDYNLDEKRFDSKITILGLALINSYENLMLDVFKETQTFKILKKNMKYYCDIEYTEKSNRWKSCPFSWEKAYELGYKAAPLLSIFELLFRRNGYDEKKISELNDAFLHLFAAIQFGDDIVDSKDDLSHGFETLVMSGYYERIGKASEVTDISLDQILTPERMKLFYQTSVGLFEYAKRIFTKHHDELLLLMLEIHYFRFLSGFDFD